MKRQKKDPTAWRSSPEGMAGYRACFAEAQAAADADGFDRGLEANDLFKTWRHFRLPGKQYRTGFELRCQVVMSSRLDVCQPGHGPC